MSQAAARESASGNQSLPDQKTPLATILTYASPAPCIGFMFFLVSMYLMKFSTDVLLIAPGVMGLIFGISRIWDGISDPLAGYLSDRTNTRFGRRRPWLLASLVPIVVVFLMMWSPPQMLTGAALVAWMAVGVIGFYTAMTIFGVPHASLGAELSMNYDDRNRVFGWRHVCFMSGAFVAIGGMRLLIASDAPRATATHLALDVDVSPALPDKAVDQGHAEARALPRLLGGEEGLEDLPLVLLVDADAGVRDLQLYVASRRHLEGLPSACVRIELDVRGRKRQGAAVGHRVARVERQVHHRVLELRRISDDDRALGMRLPLDRDLLVDDP